MLSVKWKQKERNCWESLLSKNEIFAQELSKPYSYGVLWTFVYRSNFDIILRIVGGMKKRKVLDVGCGGGWLDQWVAAEGGSPVGVDISSAFLKISKMRAQQGKFEVDLVCADGEYLPFRDNVFDCTVTYQSLHHFPCPRAVIREGLRVSNSFILGDEPAITILPRLVLKVLKGTIAERKRVGEASGIKEIRFDPKELELIYNSKAYKVKYERVWSFVPAIFMKLEKVKIMREIYRIGYFFLMNKKALRSLGHGIVMVIQNRTRK